jgi:hypothetical protein
MHTIASMVKLKVEIDYVMYFMFGFSYFVKNYKTFLLWYRSVYNSIMYNWDKPLQIRLSYIQIQQILSYPPSTEPSSRAKN